MQLNKYIAHCGAASRRGAVTFIQNNRVTVNGVPATRPELRVDPDRDIVRLDGKRLDIERKYVYILLHKPVKTLTTVRDERGRATVIDLVKVRQRVYPVGRLDYNTTGVLLLTNDGPLAYRLAHPKFEICKRYEARVDGDFSVQDADRLAAGVPIEPGITVSGTVVQIRKTGTGTVVTLEIHEGRKHQVRKMLRATGHPVRALVRTRFADLTLEGLAPGEWRPLSVREVSRLYRSAGLENGLSGQ
ncbi:rRNA pseudouridine synthase [bacterium]|nr:rRNA pseudouridine synthase [bacterium]